MAPIWILTATLLTAAPPDAATPPVDAPYTADSLRNEVRSALRDEATSTGPARAAHLRALVATFGRLEKDQDLSNSERARLVTLVRARLARRAGELLREKSAAATEASAAPRPPLDNQGVLFQQLPAQAAQRRPLAGAARATPTAAAAQELIHLIQSTIAPGTWLINGGEGTIRYFALGHVLVVRQTAEVHGQIADVAGQLRRP